MNLSDKYIRDAVGFVIAELNPELLDDDLVGAMEDERYLQEASDYIVNFIKEQL